MVGWLVPFLIALRLQLNDMCSITARWTDRGRRGKCTSVPQILDLPRCRHDLTNLPIALLPPKEEVKADFRSRGDARSKIY